MKFTRDTLRGVVDGAALGIGWALGLMFLWTGISKMRAPFDFLHAVYSYELVGPKLGLGVAAILPAVEVATAIFLIGGIARGGALLVSVLMSGVFVFAQAHAIREELDIACGCLGGSSNAAVSYMTLARATLMLAGSLTAYVHFLHRRRRASGAPIIAAPDAMPQGPAATAEG